MKEPGQPTDPDTKDLSHLLRESMPLPTLPPGFGPAVWARIRALGGPANGSEILRWLFGGWLSPALLAVLFAVGLWHGLVSGREQARQDSERRYVLSLVPESSPF